MLSIEDLSPFSESTRRIAREWTENAVVIGEDSYKFVSATGRSASGAEWRTDSDGNSVVVKRQEGKAGIAREKIAADLARLLGLPVPPARIWVKPATLSGKAQYYAVSLKAFPKAQSGLPRKVYRSDPFFPAIGIFDSWILNTDRNSGNIVGEIDEGLDLTNQKSDSQSKVAYIDHALALGAESFSLKNLLDPECWGNYVSCGPWQDGTGIEQLEIPGSVTRTVLQRIQDMPDEVIAGVVNAVPDDIYSRKQKDETIRILCEGRDALDTAYPLLDFDAAEMTPERQDQANLALREGMAAGDHDACRRAIRSGADIGAMDGDAWLATVRHGNLSLLKLLDRLAEKTSPDYRPLFLCAAEHGPVESAEYLVNKILTADLWTLDQGFTLFNDTVDGLMRDIEKASGMTPSRRESALRLIEQSEKTVRNAIQRVLYTRLTEAAHAGDVPGMKALVTAGADAHFKGGLDLLWQAAQPSLPVLRYLVEEQGFDIHVDNGIVFREAVRGGNLHIMRYLVEERGADIEIVGDDAFVTAIRCYNFAIAEYLAEKIFDPALWTGKTRDMVEAKMRSLNRVMHSDEIVDRYASRVLRQMDAAPGACISGNGMPVSPPGLPPSRAGNASEGTWQRRRII